MQVEQKKILRKLLLGGSHTVRLASALLSLCIGTTLLLLSVMIWWNFQELLSGRGDNDSLGSTFLTISKRVTNEKMGKTQLTLFSDNDIKAIKAAPQVQDVGVLIANRFPVYATMNDSLGFSTEMFLEAAPDRFIDKKPEDWYWQPGSSVPVILSSDFLNMYNYSFALSQGLPQLSEASVQAVSFNLKVGVGTMAQTYKARVVGFSDRITSVLVPDSFIVFNNRVFAPGAMTLPSRLIVKAKDPSDKAFVEYLSKNDYVTNNEQLRWSKLRSVVEVVSGATGILAILLMAVGALVFILFIELTIAKAQHSITLLLQIGYGPDFLSRFMMKRFFPLLIITALLSMCVAVGAQYYASVWIKTMHLSLPSLPGWPVWAALVVSTVILLGLVASSIIRSIKKV